MTEPVDGAEHLRSGLARLHAPLPRSVARWERRGEGVRNFARAFAAELVASHARAGLDAANEVGLRFDVRGKPVSTRSRARELALVGDFEQRQPVAGRIIGCG